MRDLNFVLRLEIFMHKDRQLQSSHLILGINLVYSTWQTFSQALLVDSPFLSYIDIWHANFLPPSLTIGEARDLGPCYTTVEDLASLRDESVEHVSRSHKDHIPVEKDETQVHATEPEATKAKQDVETVTRRKMTMDRFLLGT